MLVGNVLSSHGFQHFHRAHDAQDAVVVTAVLNGVAVRTHDDPLCVGIAAGQSRVHIGHVVRGDDGTDLGHSLHEVGAGLLCGFRQRVAGNAAVAGVTKGREGVDLFTHSRNIALIHK